MDDVLSIIIRCPRPECAELGIQGTTFNIPDVADMLARGQEIVVIGGTCGHSWSLSPAEKEHLGKFLKDRQQR